MADKTISALTSATTPLAGTEVLPIVQSSTTVKVAVNDLTVQNIRANATTGILQVTGPAAASTRIATVPDANFTVARTDAAQSFTGNQSLGTGNLVVGTSGKGIDFSAVVHSGSTSKLLADYEEGTWTPVLQFGGTSTGITYVATYQNGLYTKVGNIVTVTGVLYLSSKGSDVGTATISGIPFNSINTNGVQATAGLRIDTISFTAYPALVIGKNVTYFGLSQTTAAGVTALMTNTNFANNSYIQFAISYRAA